MLLGLLRIRITDPLKLNIDEEEQSAWNDDDFLRLVQSELLNNLILSGDTSLIQREILSIIRKKRFVINETGAIEGIAERVISSRIIHH